jgi:nitrogen regulatory protein PII
VHPVKRVEIIADEVEVHKILDRLEKIGVSNYTAIRNVLTKESRGTVSDDFAFTGLGTVYVIFYCLPDKIKTIAEEIRPILNKFGGTCYISEAMEIRSVHCVASL